MTEIKTNFNTIFSRTDLAKDEYEKNFEKTKSLQDFTNEEYEKNGVNITKNVIGPSASQIFDKPVGTYYTIDLSDVNIHDTSTLEKIELMVAETLRELLTNNKLINKKCLVVGLGNNNVTPDAIGPYVIDNTIVTRHLAMMNVLNDGFSNVCAMSPGVMGSTGIETYDVIESLLNKVEVDFVFVVDALATNSIKRINKTIQITDTGIKPGSGVGNRRKELSQNTLGIPVIAIGVPTVVDATTITVDAIGMMLKYLTLQMENKTSLANNISVTPVKENLDDISEIDIEKKAAIFGTFGKLDEVQQRRLIEEVLTPQGYNLMVTPKEIDIEVNDLSRIIANAINLALHHGLYSN